MVIERETGKGENAVAMVCKVRRPPTDGRRNKSRGREWSPDVEMVTKRTVRSETMGMMGNGRWTTQPALGRRRDPNTGLKGCETRVLIVVFLVVPRPSFGPDRI